MSFPTATFLTFLVLTFGLYWALRRRLAQNVLIAIASYAFYAWWDYRFCGLLLASSLLDFAVGLGLARAEEPRARRMLLAISVSANLGLLGFFKYFDFFASSLHAAAQEMGWQLSDFTLEVVLPVGISFYTFQTLSYTIDVYRRQIPTCRRLPDYLAYVAFFPQLVAGPIERGASLLPQFEATRSFDPREAADGCRLMLWGFFKKLVIADNLARVVDYGYADVDGLAGPVLLLATICFAFQIYCDFSGYSDIAIGVAKLFGFQLMRNFELPYFSQSIAEFWRRWHISLSTWFRDYVYIPLGGNRVPRGRVAANILITFGLSGLWHGASWNFVIWGLFHGALSIPALYLWRERRRSTPEVAGGTGRIPDVSTLLRMARTFGLVLIGWVFFRAETLESALTILEKIAGDFFSSSAWASMCEISPDVSAQLPVLFPAFFLAEWLGRRRADPLELPHWRLPLRWLVYTAVFWCIVLGGPPIDLFESPRLQPFIYFQF